MVPQSHKDSNTGSRVCPNSVRAYSVLGGTTGYTVRLIRPSLSNSLNCCVSILVVALGTSRWSSLKHLISQMPEDDRLIFSSDQMNGSFHRTGIRAAACLHFCFSFLFQFEDFSKRSTEQLLFGYYIPKKCVLAKSKISGKIIA